jgi:two-component system response regulator (stage 0 sporulation protein A)
MLVEDNEEFLNNLISFFRSDEGFDIVATARDGEQAIELFNSVRPDVLVLDLVMPGKDGFAVLSAIDKGAAKIVVLSALSQDVFAVKALELGADYYMMKPCSLKDLGERIRELLDKPAFRKKRVKTANHSIEERITNIFITVGIPAHIKGYQFLREAIKMAVDSPDIINSITKRLYPEVAEKFLTTASKVERAIRHAIEVAWNRGKIENINSLFGVRVYSNNEKPTNGEFIALVADKMLLESV